MKASAAVSLLCNLVLRANVPQQSFCDPSSPFTTVSLCQAQVLIGRSLGRTFIEEMCYSQYFPESNGALPWLTVLSLLPQTQRHGSRGSVLKSSHQGGRSPRDKAG